MREDVHSRIVIDEVVAGALTPPLSHGGRGAQAPGLLAATPSDS